MDRCRVIPPKRSGNKKPKESGCEQCLVGLQTVPGGTANSAWWDCEQWLVGLRTVAGYEGAFPASHVESTVSTGWNIGSNRMDL
jgi:hypothetical protein